MKHNRTLKDGRWRSIE